jgi:ABC-type nitrate/sulfonate/bicarbonate transport system substrate-binding protein
MTRTKLLVGGGAARFNWLPVFAADRLGFFQNAGLQIEIKRLGSVDKATAAVRDGDLDIAITPPEGAIKDAADGGVLRIIGGNANTLPLTLIAQSRFHSIESLKGAKLGTSSLTEGTALYTMEVLRRHGLNYPGDYEFAVVGVHPARWKALQEGTIDAAVQPAPLNFIALEAGFSNLGEVTDYITEIAFTSIIVHAAQTTLRRAELLVFLRAIRDATRIIYSGTEDQLLTSILQEIGEASDTYAQRTLDYMRGKNVFARDLSIPTSAFSKSVELMQKAGLADEQLITRAKRVLDLSLLAEL